MMGWAFDDGKFILPWVRHSNRSYRHPMARWVRESKQNYDWTYLHTVALCDEFMLRYDHEHSYKKHVLWIGANFPLNNLSNLGRTEPPRCFGEWKEVIGDSGDIVQDYRKYYMLAKRFATWKNRPVPEWWK